MLLLSEMDVLVNQTYILLALFCFNYSSDGVSPTLSNREIRANLTKLPSESLTRMSPMILLKSYGYEYCLVKAA